MKAQFDPHSENGLSVAQPRPAIIFSFLVTIRLTFKGGDKFFFFFSTHLQHAFGLDQSQMDHALFCSFSFHELSCIIFQTAGAASHSWFCLFLRELASLFFYRSFSLWLCPSCFHRPFLRSICLGTNAHSLWPDPVILSLLLLTQKARGGGRKQMMPTYLRTGFSLFFAANARGSKWSGKKRKGVWFGERRGKSRKGGYMQRDCISALVFPLSEKVPTTLSLNDLYFVFNVKMDILNQGCSIHISSDEFFLSSSRTKGSLSVVLNDCRMWVNA